MLILLDMGPDTITDELWNIGIRPGADSAALYLEAKARMGISTVVASWYEGRTQEIVPVAVATVTS